MVGEVWVFLVLVLVVVVVKKRTWVCVVEKDVVLGGGGRWLGRMKKT